MSLIEILISFFLVIICILPLLYPHFYVLQDKEDFIKQIELDHQVNLLYGIILEKLYLNSISWTEITNGTTFEISPKMIPDGTLVYPGTFTFKIDKIKSNEEKSKIAGLFNLIFNFQNKSKNLSYSFKIFALKDSATEEVKE